MHCLREKFWSRRHRILSTTSNEHFLRTDTHCGDDDNTNSSEISFDSFFVDIGTAGRLLGRLPPPVAGLWKASSARGIIADCATSTQFLVEFCIFFFLFSLAFLCAVLVPHVRLVNEKRLNALHCLHCSCMMRLPLHCRVSSILGAGASSLASVANTGCSPRTTAGTSVPASTNHNLDLRLSVLGLSLYCILLLHQLLPSCSDSLQLTW